MYNIVPKLTSKLKYNVFHDYRKYSAIASVIEKANFGELTEVQVIVMTNIIYLIIFTRVPLLFFTYSAGLGEELTSTKGTRFCRRKRWVLC